MTLLPLITVKRWRRKCFNITSKTVDEVSALAFALNRVHSGFESVNQ